MPGREWIKSQGLLSLNGQWIKGNPAPWNSPGSVGRVTGRKVSQHWRWSPGSKQEESPASALKGLLDLPRGGPKETQDTEISL